LPAILERAIEYFARQNRGEILADATDPAQSPDRSVVLRDTPSPMTTREITEAVAAAKGISVGHGRTRDLITKTVLSSLNRAAETIDRVKTARVAAWRVI
jgi:hypothetical protein